MNLFWICKLCLSLEVHRCGSYWSRPDFFQGLWGLFRAAQGSTWLVHDIVSLNLRQQNVASILEGRWDRRDYNKYLEIPILSVLDNFFSSYFSITSATTRVLGSEQDGLNTAHMTCIPFGFLMVWHQEVHWNWTEDCSRSFFAK